jgi:hypothetical protein
MLCHGLTVAGVMSVQATGTTQTLSWVLTAGLDTQCTDLRLQPAAWCMGKPLLVSSWNMENDAG